MAFKCDVCGEPIHLKRVNNKNYPIRCPLEKYKTVKTYYTSEFRQVMNGIFHGEDCQTDSPEGLREFSEMIPEETELMDYVKRFENTVTTRNLLIQTTKEAFFLHFNRVLINIYDSNLTHFVDCTQEANKGQFNYLWLTPTNLRECYFKNGLEGLRFKSMSQLTTPSLVIYPIGGESIEHKGWGDILLELVTNRDALGKPTWIVRSKELSRCQEVTSSERLRSYLTANTRMPKISLDLDDSDFGEDSSLGKVITQGNTSVKTGSYF